MRTLVILLLLAASWKTTSAQIDPSLNPLFRPKGSIVDKRSPRYYIWYEGSQWHLRCTSADLIDFFGSVAVDKGEITYCKLVGREESQDRWSFGRDRSIVNFRFKTADYSDGLDIRIRVDDDARIAFALGYDKHQRAPLGSIRVGESQNNPSRWPLVFPAHPSRSMYSSDAVAKAFSETQTPSPSTPSPPNANTLARYPHDLQPDANGHADSSGSGKWYYSAAYRMNPSFSDAGLEPLTWNVTRNRYEGRTKMGGKYYPCIGPSIDPAASDARFAVLRWQSGIDADVRIRGKFQKYANAKTGNGVTVMIYVNGARRYMQTMPYNDTSGVDFDLTASVKPGAFIDFVVDPIYRDAVCDSTRLETVIERVSGQVSAIGTSQE